MSYLFLISSRGGCFAISDQPTLDEATMARVMKGLTETQAHFAYHVGVRLEFWRACLVILMFLLGLDDLRTMLPVVAITLAEPGIN